MSDIERKRYEAEKRFELIKEFSKIAFEYMLKRDGYIHCPEIIAQYSINTADKIINEIKIKNNL